MYWVHTGVTAATAHLLQPKLLQMFKSLRWRQSAVFAAPAGSCPAFYSSFIHNYTLINVSYAGKWVLEVFWVTCSGGNNSINRFVTIISSFSFMLFSIKSLLAYQFLLKGVVLQTVLQGIQSAAPDWLKSRLRGVYCKLRHKHVPSAVLHACCRDLQPIGSDSLSVSQCVIWVFWTHSHTHTHTQVGV